MAKVCRCCFQETSLRNFIELDDDPQSVDIKNKIEFCVPEMNLLLTVKPVVCVLCINLLNSAFMFKKQCVGTEHSIKRFIFGLQGVAGTIDLNDIYMYQTHNVKVTQQAEDNTVEDLNNLLDDALNDNFHAITEITTVEHKIEIIEEDDDVVCLEDNLLVAKDSGDELQCEAAFRSTPVIEENNDTRSNKKQKRARRGRPRVKTDKNVETPSSNGVMSCIYCDFSTKEIEILLKHIPFHLDVFKNSEKPYFCPFCKLRSKYKFVVKTHLKKHNIFVKPERRGRGRSRN